MEYHREYRLRVNAKERIQILFERRIRMARLTRETRYKITPIMKNRTEGTNEVSELRARF